MRNEIIISGILNYRRFDKFEESSLHLRDNSTIYERGLISDDGPFNVLTFEHEKSKLTVFIKDIEHARTLKRAAENILDFLEETK